MVTEVPIAVRWHLECSFVVIQSLSHVLLFATPWTAASLVSVSFPVSRSLLKLTLVMPNNHFILSCPSYCPQSFSASGSFPMSRFLTTGDQVTGASASASVLPVNIQSWFSLGLAVVWSPTTLPEEKQTNQWILQNTSLRWYNFQKCLLIYFSFLPEYNHFTKFLLVSAEKPHESAIWTHIFPPSWASLPNCILPL